MKEFEFEIGETVYIAGCSKEYKKANSFVVAERKTKSDTLYIDGSTVESCEYIYSSGGPSWYREVSLTVNL